MSLAGGKSATSGSPTENTSPHRTVNVIGLAVQSSRKMVNNCGGTDQ